MVEHSTADREVPGSIPGVPLILYSFITSHRSSFFGAIPIGLFKVVDMRKEANSLMGDVSGFFFPLPYWIYFRKYFPRKAPSFQLILLAKIYKIAEIVPRNLLR